MIEFTEEARIVACKYWVRYFVYEDFTRRRAYPGAQFWCDDQMIGIYKFGEAFGMQAMYPEERPLEKFVVANNPKLRLPSEGERTPLLDVYLAPFEQWMLYAHLDPDVEWEVEIVQPGGS